MKLSEIKGEAALDLLADLIEPASEIMTDPEVKKLAQAKNKGAIVKVIIKNHKKAIREILAALDGVPADQYEMNIFTLPMKLLEILNDPELVDFFTSQEWTEALTSSTAPTVNTGAKEK